MWPKRGVPKIAGGGFKEGVVKPAIPNAPAPKPIKQPSFGEPKTHAQFHALGVPPGGKY
jgi:hypothetical protein